MPELEYPTWTGSGGPGDAAWNTVALGDVVLPGVCTVHSVRCGVRVNTKCGKGQDQPTSTDNGLDPAQFSIEVWLTEKDWPKWLAIVDKIHPRRPGRKRQPLEIKHPEPNVLGITTVRIVSFMGEAPTGRGGKKYTIKVEEWFDEPKPVSKKKTVPKFVKNSDYFGDPDVLARRLADTSGYILPPDDPKNIAAQLYGNNADIHRPYDPRER